MKKKNKIINKVVMKIKILIMMKWFKFKMKIFNSSYNEINIKINCFNYIFMIQIFWKSNLFKIFYILMKIYI